MELDQLRQGTLKSSLVRSATHAFRSIEALLPASTAADFERYSLECKECGTQLAGIIDPYDEELLLTELES